MISLIINYYPATDTSMPLLAVSTMALPAQPAIRPNCTIALMSEPDRRLLPAVQTIAKEDEVVMKDLDGELLTCSTTNCTEAKRLKIKLDRYHQLSTLSPSKQNIPMSVKFNTEPATPDNSSTPGPVTKTTEESDHSPGGIDELQAVSLTFVNR